MADIKVSLKHNGVDLIGSDKLTKYIAQNNIQIDEEKLHGLDNFVIAEQRANVTVNLIHQDPLFNQQITEILTNDEYRLKDNLYTRQFSTISFTKDLLINQTKDDLLFGTYFKNPTNQTWLNNQQALVPQSKQLIDIFYTMLKNGGTRKRFRSELHGLGGGVFLEYYEYLPEYSKSKYKFNNGLEQLIGFFVKGIEIDSGSTITTHLEASNGFKALLNGLQAGLGNSIKGHIDSTPIDANIDEYVYYLFNYVFYPDVNLKKDRRDAYRPNFAKIMSKIYLYMTNNGWTDMSGIQANDDNTRAAILLASLVKYEWYQYVKNQYFLDTYNVSNMKILNQIYNPFYRAQEVIVRGNSAHPTHGNSNVFFRWDANGYSPDNKTIKIVYPFPNGEGSSTPFFGKPHTQTVDIKNQEISYMPFEIDPNDQEAYNREGLFIPVERRFHVKNSDFASVGGNPSGVSSNILLDNVNYNEIAGTPSDNIACLTGYTQTNWMYFDNLTVQETYNPGGGTFDYIPVFEPDSGDADEFGVYTYSDFFNKFYTKEDSNLMDIILEVKKNDKVIYSGLVDFTSVQIENNKISFTTTDMIGLLIENLKKVNDIVNFSQFDTGDNYTSDKRAGTTILDFIDKITSNPFPYKPQGLAGTNLGLRQETYNVLNNKVLTDISSEDALLVAIQSTGKLLYCDGYGSLELIELDLYVPDDDDESEEAEIFWDNVIEIENKDIIDYSMSNGQGIENFNSESIKNLAGFEAVLPKIANQYKIAKKAAKNNMSISVKGNDDIKMLDKIYVNGKVWIVLSIDYGL